MTRRWTSNEWWNAALGRTIRTVWHWVGFYAVAAPISTALTSTLVVGAVPSVMSVPVSTVATALGTLGLAVVLSLRRPAVSSARTLAFGVVGGFLFVLLLALFGDTDGTLSGKPLVGLDIVLAGVAAVSLAAAVALEFDLADLGQEYVGSPDGETAGDTE